MLFEPQKFVTCQQLSTLVMHDSCRVQVECVALPPSCRWSLSGGSYPAAWNKLDARATPSTSEGVGECNASIACGPRSVDDGPPCCLGEELHEDEGAQDIRSRCGLAPAPGRLHFVNPGLHCIFFSNLDPDHLYRWTIGELADMTPWYMKQTATLNAPHAHDVRP